MSEDSDSAEEQVEGGWLGEGGWSGEEAKLEEDSAEEVEDTVMADREGRQCPGFDLEAAVVKELLLWPYNC